ncbi:MAG: translational GTPase TypA [Alphaproteobacteria bacterium]|nr:translational GTPase TypA [Alphaproteobacteria bacterium]MBT5389986.1 translational GTPase TypA [Alphaproteobacteria bacterium]MBT5654154.1 translational GTPase TypA [Alphaproteobacteria bacterium]
MTALRNIAIIAHVDHGKTTLVDAMLQQSGAYRENQAVTERAMDSGDLEKERGITILAKCTSLIWDKTRINIVDTPGHADFGGEVERILDMVDGVLLLVDSVDGPMPQTKFVLTKALKLGLKPIVVINKSDRPDARVDEVHSEIFDLFSALDATEEQLDFPVIFASAKEGWAVDDMADEKNGVGPLFDMILKYVPLPKESVEEPFSFLVSMMDYDSYLGRVFTGRIHGGIANINMPLKALNLKGEVVEEGRLTKLLAFRNLGREPIEHAEAGDIISIAGLKNVTVTDTLCAMSVEKPLPALPIDPPTLMMTFSVNDSPFAGREGSKVTSRMIRDRLFQEKEGNVAIRVKESEGKDSFEVAGRGELQLGVLIETMRREGFELSISRPRVLFMDDPDTGAKLEPMEEAQIDVDDEFTGVVIEKMGLRKAELLDMAPSGGGKTRLKFIIPTRGLIGYQNEFMSDTRGTGVMSRLFSGFAPYKGEIGSRRNGVLISTETGKAVAYALWKLEDRGFMVIDSGMDVYKGMIIGENSRPNDLEVNPIKEKQLTNVRASGKDDAIQLTPPRKMTLEQSMSYIGDDELIEVTPKNIRLRKRYLESHIRKRASREQ